MVLKSPFDNVKRLSAKGILLVNCSQPRLLSLVFTEAQLQATAFYLAIVVHRAVTVYFTFEVNALVFLQTKAFPFSFD